uniref:Uncharacterized protein n=1 Tax=Craspedostauros australis TaxID=1486917 RepID=A0A7R9ZM27_9STRA|mmetsp:Transcript_17476/g.48489  ORF Transcript_17476/g.48489 Transcript_17476/m.48489 type:complete len:104 (+) Transcript_17476:295-606(+)
MHICIDDKEGKKHVRAAADNHPSRSSRAPQWVVAASCNPVQYDDRSDRSTDECRRSSAPMSTGMAVSCQKDQSLSFIRADRWNDFVSSNDSSFHEHWRCMSRA